MINTVRKHRRCCQGTISGKSENWLPFFSSARPPSARHPSVLARSERHGDLCGARIERQASKAAPGPRRFLSARQPPPRSKLTARPDSRCRAGAAIQHSIGRTQGGVGEVDGSRHSGLARRCCRARPPAAFPRHDAVADRHCRGVDSQRAGNGGRGAVYCGSKAGGRGSCASCGRAAADARPHRGGSGNSRWGLLLGPAIFSGTPFPCCLSFCCPHSHAL